MPDMRVGFNTRQQPIVLDAAGHILGGSEHGAYDPNEPRAQLALTQGWLLDFGPTVTPPETPAVDDVVPSPENVPQEQESEPEEAPDVPA